MIVSMVMGEVAEDAGVVASDAADSSVGAGTGLMVYMVRARTPLSGSDESMIGFTAYMLLQFCAVAGADDGGQLGDVNKGNEWREEIGRTF